MKIKDPMILMGIADAATTVDEILLRKMRSIMMARLPPINILFFTRAMAPLMYGLWS